MTLDFVTLIAILFKLYQWSIVLRSSERVEVNCSKRLLFEDMIESSAHISAMDFKRPIQHGWSQIRSLRYTWDNIVRVWAYTCNVSWFMLLRYDNTEKNNTYVINIKLTKLIAKTNIMMWMIIKNTENK